MKKISILFVLILIGLGLTDLFAQRPKDDMNGDPTPPDQFVDPAVPSKKSLVDHGIRITISVPSLTQWGPNCVADVVIKNESEKVVEGEVYRGNIGVSLEVISNNVALEKSAWGKVEMVATRAEAIEDFKRSHPNTPGVVPVAMPLSLAPGDEVRFTENIARAYDISLSGTYLVRASWKYTGGMIQSGDVLLGVQQEMPPMRKPAASAPSTNADKQIP